MPLVMPSERLRGHCRNTAGCRPALLKDEAAKRLRATQWRQTLPVTIHTASYRSRSISIASTRVTSSRARLIEIKQESSDEYGRRWYTGGSDTLSPNARPGLTIEKAKTVNVAATTIVQQSHIGRVAAYPLMAAREGMIAIMTADSGRGPKAVAPFGGREARLGTNPICIAVPAESGRTACGRYGNVGGGSRQNQAGPGQGHRHTGRLGRRRGRPGDD